LRRLRLTQNVMNHTYLYSPAAEHHRTMANFGPLAAEIGWRV